MKDVFLVSLHLAGVDRSLLHYYLDLTSFLVLSGLIEWI